MTTTLLISTLLFSPVHRADTSETTKRTVTKLAEGVYTIRHPDAPNQFPQGNSLAVIGGKEVLVVDSRYLPSTAVEDIKQIRAWTNKPVRYLVNTHWHFDHTMGNGVYAAEFPGLKIIAHPETKKRMIGMNPGYIARLSTFIARNENRLKTGKDEQGNVISPESLEELRKGTEGQRVVLAEYLKMVDVAPNTTFEKEMKIDLGGRQVHLLFLGKGNTAGDIVAFLPKEKIVATGDLVDSPVPYLGSGFPGEQVETLRKLRALKFDTLVPGHGDPLKGREFLDMLIEFLEAVVKETQKEIYARGNGSSNEDAVVAAVRKRIDFEMWATRFCGDNKSDKEFFHSFSVTGVLRNAFRELVVS